MTSTTPLSVALILAGLCLPGAAWAEKAPVKPTPREAAQAVAPAPKEASPQTEIYRKEMKAKQFDWNRVSLAEGWGLHPDRTDGKVLNPPEYRKIGDIIYLRGKVQRTGPGRQLVGQVGEDAKPGGARNYEFIQPCSCPVNQLSVSVNLYGQLHVGATYRADGRDDVRIGDVVALDGIFYFVK